MKFFFDIFPVILFFGVFKWGNGHTDAAQGLVQQYLSGFISGGAGTISTQAPIILATAVAIMATVGQILYLLLARKKVDATLWISLAIITVFGGATIYFHDETFIKLKPTVLYWIFGVTLLSSQMLFDKNLIRKMMEQQLSLPDNIWRKLNVAWSLFFIAMGIINLYVAFNYGEATWVNFKLFGFTGLMFTFVILQGVILAKYLKEPR